MGQMWLDCFVLPQLEGLRTSRVFHQRVLALHMIVLLVKEQVRGVCVSPSLSVSLFLSPCVTVCLCCYHAASIIAMPCHDPLLTSHHVSLSVCLCLCLCRLCRWCRCAT
jgi:hypothetical protein